MSSIPCILIPLLVGLICAVLGYLLGKLFGSSVNLNADANGNASLQAELDECRKKSAQLLADYNALKASNSASTQRSGFVADAPAAAESLPFNADAAFAVLGKKIKQDDLKIVEGIGPKIEELFHGAGIKTWKALSETSVDKCNQILHDAGPRFTIHNPGTWPKQCLLAYEGKWQELKDWQDSLDGGKA